VGFYFLLAVLSVGASGLVLQGDGPAALHAGGLYFGLALLAEAFILAGLILLAAATPHGSLLIRDATAALPTSPWRDLTLTLLVIGLGIKAGLVPMHFWMPLAHGAAPMPASAVLSGIIVKSSVIALVRFLPFTEALPHIGRPLAMVGAFGAFYGVAMGITQSRPKLVLAYSSVSQMGFVMAVIGMGLSEGDVGTGLAAAAYAAHHLLVKGALFLCVGVMAATGRERRWQVILPAAVIALGLGGLPLTGGALTKYAVKGLIGEGLASALAFGSSAATTLVMLHFLRRLMANMAVDAGARAPAGLAWPWLTMAVASLAAPWGLFLYVPNEVVPKALAPASLWSALLPVLVGAGLALGLDRMARRLPRVPEGDIGPAALAGLGQVGAASGAVLERGDAFVRQWAVAGIVLITVAALFGWALAVSP
jgi:formate hydrogenlyase subunit 3/multisubunit Na+/H+ antiporter MnhD subunit